MFRAGKRAILARIIGALNRGPAGPEQARHCAPSLSFSLDIACALPSRSCVGKETREKAKTARAHTRERVSAIYASRDPALTMASIVYLEIAAGNESSLEVFRMPSFVPRERERERVREIEREEKPLDQAVSLSRRCVGVYSVSCLRLERHFAEVPRSTGCLLHGLPAIHRHGSLRSPPVLEFSD